ncbi:MAG: S-layer homology domain-containing protein [Ruminococcaceae bacterium]|nr:S-layer homology domain-containing protein [Oscillospiraceae bacterium]
MKMKRWLALLLCAVMLVMTVPAAAVIPAGESAQSGADPETEFLRQLGILVGLEEDPAAQMTRAEFCVMVVRAMGREEEVSLHTARTIFRDVTAAHWARGHINLAASITVGSGTGTRLVAGVGTGQFKPDAPITYAQAITILMRMLGYSDQQAGAIWPKGYLDLAASLGVAQGLAAHAPLTRAQASALMSSTLRAEAPGGEPYYQSIRGVASVKKVTVLETAVTSGGMDGLLRVRTTAGVEELRQENLVSADFQGYSGQLLLNAAGRAMAFLPEMPVGQKAVLSAAETDGITASGKNYPLSGNAVMIVGEKAYSWAETGSLQANCYLGSTVWLFCDDLGAVDCVYLPVEDPARAAKLTVVSAREVTVLDTAAVSGSMDGLLRVRTAAGVENFRQDGQISADCQGYSGQLLLNAAGRAAAFIPESTAGRKAVLTAAAADEVTASGKAYEMARGAVMIVGDQVYDWTETGSLQANCCLGSAVWLFCNDLGEVDCVYLAAEDPARAEKLAVTSAQTAILLNVGGESDLLTAYAVTGAEASVETFSCAVRLPEAYLGLLGRLLLNADEAVVGFIPDAQQAEDVKLASAKRSGIVDMEGVTHRISSDAAVIIEDSAYIWKETGYLQLSSHTGKTLRLYRNEKGAVVYVCLFAGGTSAQTGAIVAETVTAAAELARRLGITGTYAITKNGAPAQADDLARYDVAYFDAASGTLRASDLQFTGYIEDAYPNLTEAETVTVSGNTFVVLESAWASLADCALGGRVTLLLTDDGKAAAAAEDAAMIADMLGVLSVDGTSVTLLGSGLTLKGMKIEAQENLRGCIVQVNIYQNEVRCYACSSDRKGTLDIAAGTLGDYVLAPVCAVYEHAASGSLESHVYSLSGEVGKASYDFREISWTNTIPAGSVTACHVNTAGQVDMILLRNVTGNCYEYGRAVRYTGENGINVGTSELSAYSNAVAVANADNGGEGVKRICSSYDAQTGAYLGVAAGAYSASHQRVAALTLLKKAANADSSDFFLKDDAWYAVADAAECPVSPRVQIYLERTDRWVGGLEELPDVLAMEQPLTLYYDRTVQTGGQIRVIVVGK